MDANTGQAVGLARAVSLDANHVAQLTSNGMDIYDLRYYDMAHPYWTLVDHVDPQDLPSFNDPNILLYVNGQPYGQSANSGITLDSANAFIAGGANLFGSPLSVGAALAGNGDLLLNGGVSAGQSWYAGYANESAADFLSGTSFAATTSFGGVALSGDYTAALVGEPGVSAGWGLNVSDFMREMQTSFSQLEYDLRTFGVNDASNSSPGSDPYTNYTFWSDYGNSAWLYSDDIFGDVMSYDGFGGFSNTGDGAQSWARLQQQMSYQEYRYFNPDSNWSDFLDE